MGLTLLILAACLLIGAVGAAAARGPLRLPDLPQPAFPATMNRFSPRRTLFIIGPGNNHPACRMQRRLLKPAVGVLLRAEICVIEIYGDAPARRNGEAIDWLDPSLLRHAMDAEEGFLVVYVNGRGKTVCRSEAPMLAGDIFEKAGLASDLAGASLRGRSDVLRRLKAA